MAAAGHLQLIGKGGGIDYRKEFAILMERLASRIAAGEDISFDPDNMQLITLSENIQSDPALAPILDELGVRDFHTRTVIHSRLQQDFARTWGRSVTVKSAKGRIENGRAIWRYELDVDLGETQEKEP